MVNGKQLLDCNDDDFSVLIGNPDYRENEFLDFKVAFSFLDCQKNDPKRAKHISEFRSDVCSFANANGGYLIYGIRDENGLASEIVGIDIADGNTDRFELDRKNNLSAIMPKMPSVKFHFISLKNGKFLVILYIQNDFYAPYLHIEDESNYKFYKRIGNGKRCIGYAQLKNMFNQSLSIEKEVQRFREERIYYYKSLEDTADLQYSQFMLLHIIPDTFVDSSHDKKVFLLEKNSRFLFSGMFSSIGCAGGSVPNVDGLRFPSYQSGEECRISDNCTVEVFQPLYKALINRRPENPCGSFRSTYMWERIEPVVRSYVERMKNILDTQRVFMCISIIGCKNVATENDVYLDYYGKIDRDIVICPPVVFENISDNNSLNIALKRLHIEYALALGIKHSETLHELIQQVYQ